MHLFFNPNISSDKLQLNEEESKHCTKVLRKKKGDIIKLCDGKGNLYDAEIITDDTRKCQLKIVKSISNFGKKHFSLHIAIAPTKNISRFEWFLEKATEIGIDQVTPIICDNSERKNINHSRLKKIIISAIKQSIKAYLPKLNDLTPFDEFVSKNFHYEKFIAYLDDDVNDNLKDIYKIGHNALVLIGPEGDFSKEEIKLARENGYNPISLGKSRLRTETAGLVACHTVNLLNE